MLMKLVMRTRLQGAGSVSVALQTLQANHALELGLSTGAPTCAIANLPSGLPVPAA